MPLMRNGPSAACIRPEQLEWIVARSLAPTSELTGLWLSEAYRLGGSSPGTWFGFSVRSLIGGALVGAAVGVVVADALARFLG